MRMAREVDLSGWGSGSCPLSLLLCHKQQLVNQILGIGLPYKSLLFY